MAWIEMLTRVTMVDEVISSQAVVLHDGRNHHAIEFKVVGTGTVSITPYMSISGVSWISGGTKISGFGSISGPEADGKQIIALLLKPSDLIKFKVEAIGAVEFSLWFTQK